MMISKKQILGGLGMYFALRLFSYFFSPATPLYAANPINWILAAGILLLTAYCLLLRDDRGWLIIAAEMILGGAGNFLEIKGISLRACLLLISIIIFVVQKIKDKECIIIAKQNKTIICLLSFIFFIVATSAIRGYYLGHDSKLILADVIPYLFLLYYFPLKQLLSSEKFRQTSFSVLIAAIIGNFIFTYFTLAGFSSEIFVLQDSYYHWFRDVASGKITDYGTGFFRIMLNEQLLIVPLLTFFIGNIITNQTPPFIPPIIRKGEDGGDSHVRLSFLHLLGGRRECEYFAGPLAMVLLAILPINITRIYIIALSVGLLFLFSKTNWKRWLAYCAGALIFFIMAFTLTNLAATKGKSLGWEYLGLRLQSIAMPQTEDSALSRLLLLPKIIEKIKLHPLLGNGLGDTVTVYSPIFKQNITTTHFDWGYLEIISEMGIIGLAAWILVIGYLILKIKRNRGLLTSVVALLVINITSPALFHVIGVVWITYLLSAYNKI